MKNEKTKNLITAKLLDKQACRILGLVLKA